MWPVSEFRDSSRSPKEIGQDGVTPDRHRVRRFLILLENGTYVARRTLKIDGKSHVTVALNVSRRIGNRVCRNLTVVRPRLEERRVTPKISVAALCGFCVTA